MPSKVIHDSDYPTVQAAIDAAIQQSVFYQNLIVEVGPGQFPESLIIPKNARSFVIRGSGSNNTVILGHPALRTDGAWFGAIRDISFGADLPCSAVVELDGNILHDGSTFGVQQIRMENFSINGAQMAQNGLSIVPLGGPYGQGSECLFSGFQILSCLNAGVSVTGFNAIANTFLSGDIQGCGVGFFVNGGPVYVDGVSMENNMINARCIGSTGPRSCFRNIRSEGIHARQVQLDWAGPLLVDNWYDTWTPPAWTPERVYAVDDGTHPTILNGYQWICTVAGTGGGTEPEWATAGYPVITDGTATLVRDDTAKVYFQSGEIRNSTFPFTAIRMEPVQASVVNCVFSRNKDVLRGPGSLYLNNFAATNSMTVPNLPLPSYMVNPKATMDYLASMDHLEQFP